MVQQIELGTIVYIILTSMISIIGVVMIVSLTTPYIVIYKTRHNLDLHPLNFSCFTSNVNKKVFMTEDKHKIWMVAYDRVIGGDAVGCVCISKKITDTHHYILIHNLCVISSFRNKGVGRKLLIEADRYCQKRYNNIRSIHIHIKQSNTPSIKCFNRFLNTLSEKRQNIYTLQSK